MRTDDRPLRPSAPSLTARAPDEVEHFFTVDVEEYFQVNAFESRVARADWSRYPSRLAASMERLLLLLEERQVRGTFFTLGWIAQQHPHLVRDLAAAGHEVASHGWWHHRVTGQSRSEFREDVAASKAILEDITGRPVRGYRAPSFSVVPGGEWALDTLLECGYVYDSSLFPIRRRGYGHEAAIPVPHVLARRAGDLYEFPPATIKLFDRRMPAAGGGWFRHFPYAVTARAFRTFAEQGIATVFYIHPWELDPEQPRMDVPMLTRLRHYGGLSATTPRLRRLLGEFKFTTIGSVLDRNIAPPKPRSSGRLVSVS